MALLWEVWSAYISPNPYQINIKKNKKKNQVVSVISTKYKSMMSNFQSCQVPTAPSARQARAKAAGFFIENKTFSAVCFESQLGTAEKFRRSFHRILALRFPNSITLWQAGDLYQSFQQRSLGAESAFLLLWPGLARHCWDHHVYVSRPMLV